MATRQLKVMKVFKSGSLLSTFERNFLGSGWTFLVAQDGEAFWYHAKANKMIPSSRNYKLWERGNDAA